MLADLLQGFEWGVTPERRAAGQERAQDRPQAVDIGHGRDRAFPARRLLGRHVGGRTEHGPSLGQLAVPFDPPGQSEVGNERLAAFVDQDVEGFRSRCRMPRSWAWWTARATDATDCAAARVGSILLESFR